MKTEERTINVEAVAIVRGFLVTANKDGRVSLNARVLCKIGEATPEVERLIVSAVNAHAGLVEALRYLVAWYDSVQNGEAIARIDQCEDAIEAARAVLLREEGAP